MTRSPPVGHTRTCLLLPSPVCPSETQIARADRPKPPNGAGTWGAPPALKIAEIDALFEATAACRASVHIFV